MSGFGGECGSECGSVSEIDRRGGAHHRGFARERGGLEAEGRGGDSRRVRTRIPIRRRLDCVHKPSTRAHAECMRQGETACRGDVARSTRPSSQSSREGGAHAAAAIEPTARAEMRSTRNRRRRRRDARLLCHNTTATNDRNASRRTLPGARLRCLAVPWLWAGRRSAAYSGRACRRVWVRSADAFCERVARQGDVVVVHRCVG